MKLEINVDVPSYWKDRPDQYFQWLNVTLAAQGIYVKSYQVISE